MSPLLGKCGKSANCPSQNSCKEAHLKSQISQERVCTETFETFTGRVKLSTATKLCLLMKKSSKSPTLFEKECSFQNNHAIPCHCFGDNV